MASNVHRCGRRAILGAPAGLIFSSGARAAERIGFDDLYGAWSVTGLRFSDKVQRLAGQDVTMRGFMAPPLSAEAIFFVLTREPLSICPFCSSDAEWPPDIVVVYLRRRALPLDPSMRIEVTGRLEAGSWTDPETGFVSQLRLRNASFARG
ncbi:hypothetical protein [Neoroseomonas lacus]|uniref:DUF3299 domain-containing protein n=1 Tax=Neoroseomonas lacus TaxID=287609 RepID=A0A917NHZ8_9PROT|nr:hypothetical protein [Neoroseomonas lacus]GGI99418.1 hypothetical protein GCM10011320_02770 [Neoroseomonas lacus]